MRLGIIYDVFKMMDMAALYDLPYVDFCEKNGEKVDFSINLLQTDDIQDLHDAIESLIEITDKRISNLTRSSNPSQMAATSLKHLAQRKQRLEHLLKRIKTELYANEEPAVQD